MFVSLRGFLGRMSAVAGAIVVPALLVAQQAIAGAEDYRFELASAPVTSGKATLVKVRLIYVPDGKPASGAIIIQTRFDMSPASMAEMTAPAKVTASAEPGVYDVQAQPSMAGDWGLTLAAKVQGEAETVRGTVVIPVPK